MLEMKDKLKDVPASPGVYLWKNKSGGVIYVGKTKNLKNRLKQYFGHDTREQIPYLMAEVNDFDYIVVGNELESLFLENTLIKKYMPRYNIMLRDDKNYAFIKIDHSTQIPSITYARKIEDDAKTSKYFGPYSSTNKIRQTLDFVRKIFPYCANKEIGKRPCFYFYLHRCPGICTGQITLAEYEEQLKRITLFLSGKTEKIKRELQVSMKQASIKKRFETAARLRDQLRAIEILDERQVAMFPKRVNWDFVSIFQESGTACLNLFKLREGRLIDKESFIYQDGYTRLKAEAPAKNLSGKSLILQTFLENYYTEASDLPSEIYLEAQIPNPSLVEALLKKRASKKIVLNIPTRGQKLKLIKLGITNAQEYLRKWESGSAQSLDKAKKALEELKNILNLAKTPSRIEGYDISNIQGTNPVGSMVVIKDGLPAKSEYRKFKIRVKSTPDDFAMMEEMLTRRLSRIAISDKGSAVSKDSNLKAKTSALPNWPTPDLIVIDGGKGQLSVAVKILKVKGLKIPVIGLAKRIEEIFLPNNSEPIILAHDQAPLQLLQRLRDEAHRFAITFHRSLRSKQSTKSVLDEIPGIGPVTKKLLKSKFGTVARIRHATDEEIEKVIGKDKAAQIKKYL